MNIDKIFLKIIIIIILFNCYSFDTIVMARHVFWNVKHKYFITSDVWPKKLNKPLHPYFKKWFDRIGRDDGFEMIYFNAEMDSMHEYPLLNPIFNKNDIVSALLKVRGADEGRAWWFLAENGYYREKSIQKAVALEYPEALLYMADDAITTTRENPRPADPAASAAYELRAAKQLLELARSGHLFAMMQMPNFLSRLAVGEDADKEAAKLFLPEEMNGNYWVMKAGEEVLAGSLKTYEAKKAIIEYALLLTASSDSSQKEKGFNILTKMANDGEYEAMQELWRFDQIKGDAAGMATWEKKIVEATGSQKAVPEEDESEE
jgi:hypothetical protein